MRQRSLCFVHCCILRTRTLPGIDWAPQNVSFMNELIRFTHGGAEENLSFLQAACTHEKRKAELSMPSFFSPNSSLTLGHSSSLGWLKGKKKVRMRCLHVKGNISDGEAATIDVYHLSSTHLCFTIKHVVSQDVMILRQSLEVLSWPVGSFFIKPSPCAIHCIPALHLPAVSQLQTPTLTPHWCWGWDPANCISPTPLIVASYCCCQR